MGERCPYAISGSEIQERLTVEVEEGTVLDLNETYCGAVPRLDAYISPGGSKVSLIIHGKRRPCVVCNQNHQTCQLRKAMLEKKRASPIYNSNKIYYEATMRAVKAARRIFKKRIRYNDDWFRAANDLGVTWGNTK